MFTHLNKKNFVNVGFLEKRLVFAEFEQVGGKQYNKDGSGLEAAKEAEKNKNSIENEATTAKSTLEKMDDKALASVDVTKEVGKNIDAARDKLSAARKALDARTSITAEDREYLRNRLKESFDKTKATLDTLQATYEGKKATIEAKTSIRLFESTDAVNLKNGVDALASCFSAKPAVPAAQIDLKIKTADQYIAGIQGSIDTLKGKSAKLPSDSPVKASLEQKIKVWEDQLTACSSMKATAKDISALRKKSSGENGKDPEQAKKDWAEAAKLAGSGRKISVPDNLPAEPEPVKPEAPVEKPTFAIGDIKRDNKGNIPEKVGDKGKIVVGTSTFEVTRLEGSKFKVADGKEYGSMDAMYAAIKDVAEQNAWEVAKREAAKKKDQPS